MIKRIAIIGLGLIGGSFAKAIKKYTSASVAGYDISESTMEEALATGAIDSRVEVDKALDYDLIILALYPLLAEEFIRKNISHTAKHCIITDICGVKEYVCTKIGAMCTRQGISFIGGHPMAGREAWGFSHANEALFAGASMILTPCEDVPTSATAMLSELYMALGFGGVVLTSAKEHDRIIAFTSQLAHIVSNAYVKSPSAPKHKGFSAGSFKDLTRVAKLQPEMWAQLFLLNRDYLLCEVDRMIESLSMYREAIANEDEITLRALLKEGSDRKDEISK